MNSANTAAIMVKLRIPDDERLCVGCPLHNRLNPVCIGGFSRTQMHGGNFARPAECQTAARRAPLAAAVVSAAQVLYSACLCGQLVDVAERNFDAAIQALMLFDEQNMPNRKSDGANGWDALTNQPDIANIGNGDDT